MDSVYTTTITDEAQRRGIGVEVIDPDTPIFLLKYKSKKVRCYNALTDRIGAATFALVHDKYRANQFLAKLGFPVPSQELYINLKQAGNFLSKHKKIVVKPVTQEGGCGVSVAIQNIKDLQQAVKEAGRYSDARVILEEYVPGVDNRLILIDYKFIAALERKPAFVTGNGQDNIKTLIKKKNDRIKKRDPHNLIPVNNETRRNLISFGLSYSTVPARGKKIQVRRTSNYHTGGTMRDVSKDVNKELTKTAGQIVKVLKLPVAGVDFLIDRITGKYQVIEVSPDLGISPRSGPEVPGAFVDYLFPETKK